jgi:hypothetical protein
MQFVFVRIIIVALLIRVAHIHSQTQAAMNARGCADFA